MRNLNKNKRKIYYALRTGETPITDEYGNETGESTPTYGEINALMCNVSGSSGGDAVEAFGHFTNYTRTICVADNTCPITEDSVVWFGVEPTEPYNYIVTLRADSKNGILYGLREVSVSV